MVGCDGGKPSARAATGDHDQRCRIPPPAGSQGCRPVIEPGPSGGRSGCFADVGLALITLGVRPSFPVQAKPRQELVTEGGKSRAAASAEQPRTAVQARLVNLRDESGTVLNQTGAVAEEGALAAAQHCVPAWTGDAVLDEGVPPPTGAAAVPASAAGRSSAGEDPDVEISGKDAPSSLRRGTAGMAGTTTGRSPTPVRLTVARGATQRRSDAPRSTPRKTSLGGAAAISSRIWTASSGVTSSPKRATGETNGRMHRPALEQSCHAQSSQRDCPPSLAKLLSLDETADASTVVLATVTMERIRNERHRCRRLAGMDWRGCWRRRSRLASMDPNASIVVQTYRKHQSFSGPRPRRCSGQGGMAARRAAHHLRGVGSPPVAARCDDRRSGRVLRAAQGRLHFQSSHELEAWTNVWPAHPRADGSARLSVSDRPLHGRRTGPADYAVPHQSGCKRHCVRTSCRKARALDRLVDDLIAPSPPIPKLPGKRANSRGASDQACPLMDRHHLAPCPVGFSEPVRDFARFAAQLLRDLAMRPVLGVEAIRSALMARQRHLPEMGPEKPGLQDEERRPDDQYDPASHAEGRFSAFTRTTRTSWRSGRVSATGHSPRDRRSSRIATSAEARSRPLSMSATWPRDLRPT